METQSVGIIGMGRWGSALAASLRPLELQIHCRDRHESMPLEAWVAQCDVLCLAVRDDQMGECVSQLSTFDLSGKTVLCHSGQKPLAALAPLKQARIGKFHPLFSFSSIQARPVPAGIHFAAEGDIASVIEPWCSAWGAKLHWLAGDDWFRYHLAAVIASNFLPLLVRAGAELLQPLSADLGDALEWLAPLVRNSLNNGLDPNNPLPYSGPAIRADQQTLNAHQDLLARLAPQWLALYREASSAIASRKNS